MNHATPHAPRSGDGRGDHGRAILEALVALSLVALAVVGWSQTSLTAGRTVATADHREIALELATNALEQLTVRDWAVATIDPASPGATRRFEGRDTVTGPGGAPARAEIDRDGRQFVLVRHITDSGSATWRHVAVIVEWVEGVRTAEVRLDSALRRPDDGVTP